MTHGQWEALALELANGSFTALGRAISIVEDRRDGWELLLDRARAGRPLEAKRLGITGSPGVGKSSLVREIAGRLRAGPATVGVLAVDPSSARSGGAFLGDRIRLGDLGSDNQVFFRSMASRRSTGGLGHGAPDVLDLMDAFGFSHLLVETVGVGQVEGVVAGVVDTVAVVLMPGQGDIVQLMKSGLLEIADLFVINKADLPGADRLERELREARNLGEFRRDVWSPPVVRTRADVGEGVDAVLAAAEAHRSDLLISGELDRRRRARAERNP